MTWQETGTLRKWFHKQYPHCCKYRYALICSKTKNLPKGCLIIWQDYSAIKQRLPLIISRNFTLTCWLITYWRIHPFETVQNMDSALCFSSLSGLSSESMGCRWKVAFLIKNIPRISGISKVVVFATQCRWHCQPRFSCENIVFLS